MLLPAEVALQPFHNRFLVPILWISTMLEAAEPETTNTGWVWQEVGNVSNLVCG